MLAIDRVCPKCGYQRSVGDAGSPGECPRCGVVYKRFDISNRNGEIYEDMPPGKKRTWKLHFSLSRSFRYLGIAVLVTAAIILVLRGRQLSFDRATRGLETALPVSDHRSGSSADVWTRWSADGRVAIAGLGDPDDLKAVMLMVDSPAPPRQVRIMERFLKNIFGEHYEMDVFHRLKQAMDEKRSPVEVTYTHEHRMVHVEYAFASWERPRAKMRISIGSRDGVGEIRRISDILDRRRRPVHLPQVGLPGPEEP